MSKIKGGSGSGTVRGIAVGGPKKVLGGYQGPRGGLGTPPTGNGGGGGSGGSGNGGGFGSNKK